MRTFHPLSKESDPERFILEVLPWLHEAGNPYFNWLFGGYEAARKSLAAWMRRASSEVSISRVTLFLDEERPVGGFLGLKGADLIRSRKADMIALLKETGHEERSDLFGRMAAVRDLFPLVEADEFYLSKMGVVADLRGTGLGRALVMDFLDTGRAAGFWKFRLDVGAENRPAIQLYTALGFRVVRESASSEARVKYLSMVREDMRK